MPDIREVINAVTDGARRMLETRIQTAMAIAGVTVDDLGTGRARGEYRVNAHCACNGTGIVTTREDSNLIVDICPCLEVVVVKRVAGK